jgi:hypothetical protein
MSASRRLALVVKDDLPDYDIERGNEFAYGDALFYAVRDGKLFDWSDWQARDMAKFMEKDYKGRQIDLVQSLPITSAEYSIEPAKGGEEPAQWLSSFWAADELSGGCEQSLGLIISQLTSAFAYRKSCHELVWTRGRSGDFEHKSILKRVSFRPQTTVRLARDAKNGRIVGFEQESYYSSPEIQKDIYPVYVKKANALIYVHGERRDPINGISEMEIPYWAWKTKQRVLFLVMEYLAGVALPKTVVKGQDKETVLEVARTVAATQGSGVVPVWDNQGPQGISVDTLDVAGKGIGEFTAMISWLDQCATNSVLAGFLDLPSAAANGRGSNALSSDASDFYLQTREADAHEIENVIRRQLFAPLVRLNFGPNAPVPRLRFEPLNAEDKTAQVTMLTDLMRSRDPALVPDDFIAQLAEQVAEYLGMDGKKIAASFEDAAHKARVAAAAAQEAQQINPAQAAIGTQVAGVAGAVNKAGKVLRASGPPPGRRQPTGKPAGKPAAGAPPASPQRVTVHVHAAPQQ